MSADEKTRVSGEISRSDKGPLLPISAPEVERSQPSKPVVHPSVYVVVWISLSSSVILFNKWILDTMNFRFPVILTTYHLVFATIMTQLLARYTSLLDGRHTVKMNGRVYLRAIVPIGLFFSLSLICGNLTYLYLSVAFIQMLKATTPVVVVLSSWAMGIAQPNMGVLANVSVIVFGVVLASIGEIKFVLIGFLYQCGGIVFEALRLNSVQALLSSAEYKMDPLVSLYYFAPVCAVMNFAVALFWEIPKVTMDDFYRVGLGTLFANGLIAFLLNVSVVFLIGKTSSLVLTLCGVLKDVMLVFASMVIWGTQVTPLQFIGYGIALCGMVYFKLGYDNIKKYLSEGGRQWGEFSTRQPALSKVVLIASSVLLIFFILGGLAPAQYDSSALMNEAANAMGIKGA